jgi:hypothetical protein
MSDKIPGDILEDQSVPGAPTTVRRGPPKVVEPASTPAPVPEVAPKPEAALPFGTVVGVDEDDSDQFDDDEEATNDGEDE